MIERYLAAQAAISRAVRLRDGFDPAALRLVAAADQAFVGDTVLSGVVVCELPRMAVVEQAWAERRAEIPYIPGLLAFREGPAVLAALRRLKAAPDVLLVDGQGIAHPRRAGLACYVGVKAGLPTIGVAKSHLVGEYNARAERARLFIDKRQVGWARARGHRRLFISPGHLVSISTSLRVVEQLLAPNQFLPEPARAAHLYVCRVRRERFPSGFF